MPSTLKMLRDDLRARLNEANARQWEDTFLNTWINEGARDLTRRTECLRDTAIINTTIGTQEYTGPTDTVRLHTVSFDDGDGYVGQLEYRDFQSMSQVWGVNRTSEGTPSVYTTWGMPPNLKITLFPVPSTAGGSIIVLYYRLPAQALSDTTTIEVPEGWEDAVVTYAESMAFRRDSDQRWRESKELYEEKMRDLYTTALRYGDQSGMIDMWNGGTGGIPAWLVEG